MPSSGSLPPRRILFLAPDVSEIGGIQGYSRDLVDALREAGAEVDLVERRPGGWLAKAAFLLRILASILRRRPDFVFCAHLHFTPVGRVLKRWLGAPFGVGVYGIEAVEIRRNLHRKGVAEASVIVYLFEYTLDQVDAQVPGTRAKSFALMSAVDGERFRILPRSDELLDRWGLRGRRVLLTLGRIHTACRDNKGYHRVLQALPRVIAAVPDVVYVLAGGGDDLENVRKDVRVMGLDSHVVLPGPPPFEALPDYYNLAELFVLPSKREGFPAIVLLESLACGVPVIGGDQPGAAQAMLHGALGRVVPPDDAKALAEALIQALTQRPAAWQDREALRTLALERYGAPRFQAEVSQLLERIEASLNP